eukprot:5707118-Pleurochrysis_carterae.AAC.1
MVDSARRRFGCTSCTDSSSEETSRRVSATLPEAADVMRGPKSSSTLCTVLHERGGGHDVARRSSVAAGRGAEMPLLPAAPIGAMHLVMIAAYPSCHGPTSMPCAPEERLVQGRYRRVAPKHRAGRVCAMARPPPSCHSSPLCADRVFRTHGGTGRV